MSKKIIASFTVSRLEILDEQGRTDAELMPDLTDDDLVRLYELMLLTRQFDQRALHLQREGRLGTYPSVLGQEASQVGSAYALQNSDWLFPAFRELGVFVTLGYPLAEIYQYWNGDERGLLCPEQLNIFPICIAVGTHIPHAVGAAMAARYRGDPIATACYFGDGGTSKGDFHEGLNMAGVFQAPVVFIIQNNQWAISISRNHQTAAETLAQKAIAYGIPGIQVDGNDVLAVYQATREALQRARSGGGPSLIECETYRMADHTTADDAARYRDPEEVQRWQRRDPLLRMRRFLADRGLWDDARQQQLETEIDARLDRAVAREEATPPARARDIFAYTWTEMTPRQKRQLQQLRDLRELDHG
ncbi:pyruvate dehydrogenase (acetyl-transferring) E1 component subunit alpha [Geothermobacter hydrogeniphilus]|uniref:Pyruvate dehydrogenase E1 component subunit alpha n=1 Tax=Geothermobacter hydrogeniphilus TaxID=1969733 RepID=A0A2K2H5H9_9BACT|nr:pyruvate dehydrogenase (acetyl-transferring) E1 component subunit alpha [Geothermobacter hydrogeniphilus]PNU18586.1 pyruvate dehydrogenase (acetyl-transferring) E1 component subunit alpha [Geothermobacter hydrogeniphilus]